MFCGADNHQRRNGLRRVQSHRSQRVSCFPETDGSSSLPSPAYGLVSSHLAHLAWRTHSRPFSPPSSLGSINAKEVLYGIESITKGDVKSAFTKVAVTPTQNTIWVAGRHEAPSLQSSGTDGKLEQRVGAIDHFPTLAAPAVQIRKHWFIHRNLRPAIVGCQFIPLARYFGMLL